MVFISSKNAAGWNGLTEEKIKIWLREREVPQNGEDRKELEVVGVFAVPYVWFVGYTDDSDIAALRDKVDHRATVFDRLEVAEARYIRHRDEPDSPTKLGPLDPGSKSSRTTGAEVPSLGRWLTLLSMDTDVSLHESTGRRNPAYWRTKAPVIGWPGVPNPRTPTA
jgi:hypothetical protein